MNYTVPELMLLITAISAAVVSIITAWRTKGSIEAKVVNEADKTREEVKINTKEVEKVHVLTNDRATKQDERIKGLDEEIKKLIAMLAEKEKEGAILADRIEQRVLNEEVTQVVKNQVVENQVVEKIK